MQLELSRIRAATCAPVARAAMHEPPPNVEAIAEVQADLGDVDQEPIR